MVAVTPKVTSSKQTVVTPAVEKKYVTFEAEDVDTDNTIPISELTDIIAAAVFKKSDGSAVTFTEATNVITITQAALTDVDLIGFAYGT
jgi:hypothetical protein